jgi:hypothetical protein
MQGFEYPTEIHVRRHGPDGYEQYESYRDWVRDEFMFRCVYCLHRERWCGREATFQLDHFVPVAKDPAGKLEYTNLLYACGACNLAKRAILGVPDPCSIAFGKCVSIKDDGQVEALNDAGKSLVGKLRLNSAKTVEYRHRWMRTLAALRSHDPSLYREHMAFPDELPDLRMKKVPRNARPESVATCYFALRERGELPQTY